LVLSSGAAKANDIYIAQSATGAGNGQDCADAYAYGFFNVAGNWGSGANQIGPGTTVHLCGTITTALTAYGSGSSGHPITILFDSASGGQISMAALPTSGGLVLNGKSYITVDGNNGAGAIQSTSNGSPKANCPSSTYTNALMSVGISAGSANNIEVRNLTVGPLYIHVCTADDNTNHTALTPPGPVAISFNGTNNLTVDGNTFHDGGWLLNGGGNSIFIHNNSFYNMDHGVGMGYASSAATMASVYAYNNDFGSTQAWDTDDNSFHHDGVHFFAYCANGSSYCSATYIQNLYVYNNHFHGIWDQNVTSFIFYEGNIQTSYIFNNWGDGSQMGAGPYIFETQGNNIQVFNNTIVGYTNTASQPGVFQFGGPNQYVENNIISTGKQLIGNSAAPFGFTTTISSFSHNLYANGGNNAFVWCAPSGGSCSFLGSGSFANYESLAGETQSVYQPSAGPNGVPPPGSAAISAGANLYSICNGQPNPGVGALCYDAAGSQRPSSGPWDAGAYNFPSGIVPSPPSGLSAVAY